MTDSQVDLPNRSTLSVFGDRIDDGFAERQLMHLGLPSVRVLHGNTGDRTPYLTGEVTDEPKRSISVKIEV